MYLLEYSCFVLFLFCSFSRHLSVCYPCLSSVVILAVPSSLLFIFLLLCFPSHLTFSLYVHVFFSLFLIFRLRFFHFKFDIFPVFLSLPPLYPPHLFPVSNFIWHEPCRVLVKGFHSRYVPNNKRFGIVFTCFTGMAPQTRGKKQLKTVSSVIFHSSLPCFFFLLLYIYYPLPLLQFPLVRICKNPPPPPPFCNYSCSNMFSCFFVLSFVTPATVIHTHLLLLLLLLLATKHHHLHGYNTLLPPPLSIEIRLFLFIFCRH